MQRIFNKDGFNWWIGVVEDRMDPETLGRVRVRIFGYHTDNKTLLPTEDLPWAIPIQPITSAGISGIGSSPLGPLEGSWVIGFFLDGEDMQQPAVFGTISSKATQAAFPSISPRPSLVNPNDGIVRDDSGNAVTDSANVPIKAGVPKVDGWELGKTSERYESGGRGPGTINAYNGAASGDLGGASYGTYQFASYLPKIRPNGKARPSANNSPLIQFLNSSKFKSQFAGLTPATPQFDAKWREIASTYRDEFEKEQHDYIKRNYYDVAIANLQRNGIDLSRRGPGVQDLVWSTAVQLGPARTDVFVKPLRGKSELSDREIVLLVSEYKINNVDRLFRSSSPNIRQGVKNRYVAEKSSLLSLTGTA